jgi:membrane-bound lytic murein transglycosylase D
MLTGRLARAAVVALAAAACRGTAVAPSAPTPAPNPAPAQLPDSVPMAVAPAVERPAPATTGDSAQVSPNRVTREAVRIFGDSVAATEVDSSESAEPTWDIDVRSYETHQRVEFYVQRFTKGMPGIFTAWMERGTRYDPMIRAKLRAKGLPEDMTYLALIESGYNPHAYSSAAAVGMWQFMTATAKGTGLRVDWWVDERRDPVRSTDAAIKFLTWLNDQFGSLYLAAAAYNGGPGRVSRGLSRYADEMSGAEGEDRFFALAEQNYLHSETKDYVPKLIAAAIVAKEPERYGLKVRQRDTLAYDSVRVGPATPLMAVAAASGSSLAEIAELNPHILRGMTPPSDSFRVRIPTGRAATFDSLFAELPAEERTAFTRVTTKKSETTAGLAKRLGLTTKQLAWYNRGLKSTKKTGRLLPGQTVLVPKPFVVAAALDVPDPAVERYGSSSRGRAATHVVKRGESLGGIARKYKTTAATLKRLNGFKRDVIFPGQVIVVRGAARSGRSSAASRSSGKAASKASSGKAASSSKARAKPTAPAGSRTHVVRSGESLSEIAERYGISVSRLKSLNGLKGTSIRAGQRLVVRG